MLIGIELKSKKGYEGKESLDPAKVEHLTIETVEGGDAKVRIGNDLTIGTVDLMQLKQAIDVAVSMLPKETPEGPIPRSGAVAG